MSRRKSERVTAAEPTYSFCEHVTAGSNTPWHIRLVGPEGIKQSGGAKAPLCDRPWMNGWDLTAPVTPATVERFVAANSVCGGCATAYTELTTDNQPAGR